MELFIEKLDQELFTAYNVDNDMDKVSSLWKKITRHPIVIKNACKLIKEQNVFESPMMVFMVLKYPKAVSPEVFESIKKIVLSNKEVANTMLLTDGMMSDTYLSLILQNKDIILTAGEKAFIKNAVFEQSSFNNPVFKGIEYKLFTKEEEQDVKLSINDLYIQMGEEELNFINKRKNKKVVSEESRSTYDARYYVFGNPNFTGEEKKYLGHYMYNNPYEFEHVVSTILFDITKKCNLDGNPYRLLMLSDEELDALGVLNEVNYVKSMIDTREEKEKLTYFVNVEVPMKRVRA